MRSPAKIEHGVRCCASINIDKCTGCPYQYLYKGVGCRTQLFRDVQDYLKEIRKTAARIEVVAKQLESAQPKWISVEERLPEHNTAVIVAFDDGHVFQALYAYDGWDLWDGCTGKITHWMPLPNSPKEG